MIQELEGLRLVQLITRLMIDIARETLRKKNLMGSRNKRNKTKYDYNEIESLRASGISMPEIATKLGYNFKNMERAFHRRAKRLQGKDETKISKLSQEEKARGKTILEKLEKEKQEILKEREEDLIHLEKGKEIEKMQLELSILSETIKAWEDQLRDEKTTENRRTIIIGNLRAARKEKKRLYKKINPKHKKQKKQKKQKKPKQSTFATKTTKTTVPDFKAEFEAPDILLGKNVVEHILVGLNEYTTREVMGILLGRDVQQGTAITDCVILPQNGSGGHVTLEDDAIAQYMSDNMNLFEDGLRVVGWWHTHPNFGTGQSSTDKQNDKNLIAPFVYGKKPCYMFSIITAKKWERGGNMYKNMNNYKQYERGPITVEDIQLGLYAFFTLGGFYAEDTIPQYFIDKDAPYSAHDIDVEDYLTIFETFESAMVDKKVKTEVPAILFPLVVPPEVNYPEGYDETANIGLTDDDLVMSQEELNQAQLDFLGEDPLNAKDDIMPPDLAAYRCDITGTCDMFIPIQGDKTGRLCDEGTKCGIRSDEIGLDVSQYGRYT